MSCLLEICMGIVREEMSHITVTMITPPGLQTSRLVTNQVLVAVVSKFSEVQSTLTCSLYITPNSLLLLDYPCTIITDETTSSAAFSDLVWSSQEQAEGRRIKK